VNIYVDSSALVKLVVEEVESTTLAQYFDNFRVDNLLTAAIAHTELLRAVARRGAAVAHARTVLSRFHYVALTPALLDVAAVLPPPELRSLDAIHLAAAMTAPDLRAFITYDRRLADAAGNAGLAVVSPS
jgi:uncharacterized protein